MPGVSWKRISDVVLKGWIMASEAQTLAEILARLGSIESEVGIIGGLLEEAVTLLQKIANK